MISASWRKSLESFDQVVVFLTFRGVMRKSLISRFANRESPVIPRGSKPTRACAVRRTVSRIRRSPSLLRNEFVGVKKLKILIS